VRVDKKRFAEKTPAVIRGLLPGNYRLDVSLKGHRPWTRTVPVRTERATVLDGVILLAEEGRRETLLADEFDDLIPLRNPRFFLLAKGPLLADLFVYEPETAALSPMVPEDFPFGGARVSSYSPAERGESVLFRTQLGLWGEEKLFWVDLKHPAARIREVTRLLEARPESVDWDPRHPDGIFAWKEGVLARLDLASGAVHPGWMYDVRGYGFFDRKIYALRGDGLFQKVGADGEIEETLELAPPLEEALAAGGDFFKIRILSRDDAVFLGRNGSLWVNYPPYGLIGRGVAGIEPDPASRRAAVWRNDALGILERTRGKVRVDWVTQGARKIAQVFWVDGGSHLLFRDGGEVYLVKPPSRALPEMRPEVRRCLRVKRGSSILFSEVSGKIYFVERDSGHFCAWNLLPKAEGAADAI
jgi:hypothetical protein